MKSITKIFIVASLMLSTCVTLSAKHKVTVHKIDGGWTAIFNLYNSVDYEYTLDDGVMSNATLTCKGMGYSRCKIGKSLNAGQHNEYEQNEAYLDMLNEIIENAIPKETKSDDVRSMPYVGYKSATSKKLYISRGSSGYYVNISASWSSDEEGNVKINIESTSTDNLLGGHFN
jgi:hypothetical protein